MKKSEDRCVLLTGASGGIGAACARSLPAAGMIVVLHDIDDQRLAGLAQEIGDRCHVVSADLEQPQAADELWEQALSWCGRIDVLVNNAGIYDAAVVDGDLEAWNAAWRR